MKTILCVLVSLCFASNAHAGFTMQAVEKAPEVSRSEPSPLVTKKPERKTRLSELSKADRTTGTFVFKDNCLRFTGSRLLRDDRGDNQRCAPANGRVYLREDMDTSVTQMLR
ncbi:MAG: hypothetical protein EOP92_01300 [Lysobacteraceae bacterium]|nr:MAG: hypothetical protein EOP92_01300 [Xanthomonadaceae bacterium]